MADSRVVAGKLQDEPRTFFAKEQESAQKMMGDMSKTHRSHHEGVPTGQIRICGSK